MKNSSDLRVRGGLEDAEGVEEDAEDGDGADVAEEETEDGEKAEGVGVAVGEFAAQEAAVDFPAYEHGTDEPSDGQADV